MGGGVIELLRMHGDEKSSFYSVCDTKTMKEHGVPGRALGFAGGVGNNHLRNLLEVSIPLSPSLDPKSEPSNPALYNLMNPQSKNQTLIPTLYTLRPKP